MSSSLEITRGVEESPVEVASWIITIAIAQTFSSYIKNYLPSVHNRSNNGVALNYLSLLYGEKYAKARDQLATIKPNPNDSSDFNFGAHVRMATIRGEYKDDMGESKALANRAFLLATSYLEDTTFANNLASAVPLIPELVNANENMFVPHYAEQAHDSIKAGGNDMDIASFIGRTQHDIAYWLDH